MWKEYKNWMIIFMINYSRQGFSIKGICNPKIQTNIIIPHRIKPENEGHTNFFSTLNLLQESQKISKHKQKRLNLKIFDI
jgi:hypothetical protein